MRRREEEKEKGKKKGKKKRKVVVEDGGGRERDDLNAWLTRSFPRVCCVSALPPALSLQGHRCGSSGDCTDCNTQTEKVQGYRIVLDPKRGCDPGMCYRLWLRVLAYSISFTVLSRSPRTAASNLALFAFDQSPRM